MLSRHNAVDIEHVLRSTSPPPPFPPASDRQAWEQVRVALGEEGLRVILALSEPAREARIRLQVEPL